VTAGTLDLNWTMVSSRCIGNGSTSTIELYVNGVSVGTANGSHTNINSNKYMCIGSLRYSTSSYLNSFDGKLHTNQIFLDKISSSQIKMIYGQKDRIKS